MHMLLEHSPLVVAVRSGNLGVLRTLLEANPAAAAARTAAGDSLLHVLADEDFDEATMEAMARLLLEADGSFAALRNFVADPAARDAAGRTPLQRMVANHNPFFLRFARLCASHSPREHEAGQAAGQAEWRSGRQSSIEMAGSAIAGLLWLVISVL